jgi:four helix bundle protein
VAANIVEGWAKRRYPSVFKRHLLDAEGSCSETKLWLDFARDSGYFTPEAHERLMEQCEEIGKMLYALRQNWR